MEIKSYNKKPEISYYIGKLPLPRDLIMDTVGMEPEDNLTAFLQVRRHPELAYNLARITGEFMASNIYYSASRLSGDIFTLRIGRLIIIRHIDGLLESIQEGARKNRGDFKDSYKFEGR